MWDDMRHINGFYETPSGTHVKKTVTPLVDQFWMPARHAHNVAFGYAVPFISDMTKQANNAPSILPFVPTGLMPDGLMPDGLIPDRLAPEPHVTAPHIRGHPDPNAPHRGSAIVDAHQWPLQDVQLDRVLLAHALEFDARPDLILGECWRVLDGSGKLLVMVAHRHGLWAQAERTPFGKGQPFSRRQLRTLLTAAGFEITQLHCVIHTPPAILERMANAAPTIDAIGRRLWPMLGGVLVAEANKLLYAPAGNTSKLRRSSGLQPARLAPQTGRTFSAPSADRTSV